VSARALAISAHPRKMRHIRNSLAICSLVVRQFLLTVRRLTIAQVGMAGLTG
jgi:hypothetical protein